MVSMLMKIIVLPILMGIGVGFAFFVHPVFGVVALIAESYYLLWYITVGFDEDIERLRYAARHRA